MSAQLSAIAQVHLRAARNGWRQDIRLRTTLWIQIVLLAGLSVAAALWLSQQLEGWQGAGVDLHLRLWLLVLGTWAGVAVFSVLGVFKAGFGSDEARLLMTLPLSPAVHFRILYSLVFVEQAGVLLILWLLGCSLTLGAALGVAALPWLLLALVGSAAVALAGTAILLWLMHHGLLQPRRLLLSLFVFVVGIEVIVLWLLPEEGETLLNLALPAPLPVTLILAVLLAVGLGPKAAAIGHLYAVTFEMVENRARARRAFTFPGVGALVRPLLRARTLTAGLLVRAILEQNRHPLALPRLAVLPVYVLLFGLLRPHLLAVGFPEASAAAATGAMMGGLLLVEYGFAYALSGEGARLALYLTAPLRMDNLLRAKLVAVLLPVMLIGWIALAAMAAGMSMSTAELLLALGTTTLFLIGVTGFVVWAGVADVDLNVLPHGTAEMIVQEELPITPRRLQLLGAGFAVLAVAIALLWWLPLGQVLALAGLVCGGLLWLGWRMAQSGMRSLVA